MGATALRREKPGVDICALNDTKCLVQASQSRFAMIRSLNSDLSKDDIRPLHKYCQNGDHYMARSYVNIFVSQLSDEPPIIETRFYIIRNKSCTEVSNLGSSSDCKTYTLHAMYRGGSFYLANRTGFFIIHRKGNTFLHTWSLTTSTTPQSLHEAFRDGLYYFATDDFFYVVKTHATYGLVYHRTRSLSSAGEENIVPISESVAAFIRNEVQLDLPTKGKLEDVSSRVHSSDGQSAGGHLSGAQGSSKGPTLDDLVVLKYVDKGEEKKVRIINEASHKWKDIVSLICSDANRIRVLEQLYRGDPTECLRQAFVENFIDKKPQKYSKDWNGLIELLNDVDLETLAEKVQQALSCM